MDKIKHLIVELGRKEIHLFVEDGRLKTKAKPGSITTLIAQKIRDNKADLIDWIKNNKDSEDLEYQVLKSTPLKQYSLSEAQNKIWFSFKVNPNSNEYSMPARLRVHGNFDIEIAKHSIARLLQKHQILNSSFIEIDNIPYLTRREYIQINVEYQHVVFDAIIEEEIDKHLLIEVNKPFDLLNEPLVRVKYFEFQGKSETIQLLFFNIHHIVFDGYSFSLLIKDFSEFYNEISCNKEPLIDQSQIDYFDYLVWSASQSPKTDFIQGINFWKSYLSNSKALHGLPIESTRSNDEDPKPKRYVSHRKYDLNNFQNVLSEEKITLFTFLQSVIALSIGRVENSTDVIVGTPVANRGNNQFTDVVGMFVNTIAIRSNLAVKTVGDFLSQQREHIYKALSYQHIPFEKVIEATQVERSSFYSPIFQILFSVVEKSDLLMEVGGLNLSFEPENKLSLKAELDITAEISNGRVQIIWDYDSCLFSRVTIERLDDYVELFISFLTEAGSSQPLEINKKLTFSDLTKLDKVNEHVQEDSSISCKTLSALMQESFAKHACNTMITANGQQFTYKHIDEVSDLIVIRMLEHGIKPGMNVGIYAERNYELVVYLIAAIKMGCCFIPLDHSYPADRIHFMLDDANISCLLSTENLIAKLDECLNTPFVIDENIFNEKLDKTFELPEVDLDNKAYMLYTSGSSGQPKGVIVSQRAISLHIQSVIEYFNLDKTDTFFNCTSFSFDTFLEQTLATVLCGGEVVLSQQILLSSEDLFTYINDFDITTLDLNPSYFTQVLATTEREFWSNNKLRRIIVGGESLSQFAIDKWNDLGLRDQIKLYNAYGPTEAVITTTIQEIEAASKANDIGYVIGDRQLYVLDEEGEKVPYGAVGELHVGGVCIADGYFNLESKTTQSFLASKCGRKILYKTGDLVRFNNSGGLEFLGRRDEQVNLNGIRVELGEINQVIEAIPSINQAVVSIDTLSSGTKKIVAWVTTSQTNEVESLVKEVLRSKLPSYMVPDRIIVVENFPMLPNGKIDRSSLKLGNEELILNSNDDLTTETEQVLARIWSDVLSIDANIIGSTSDFFKLGGSSILLIQIIARIHTHFKVKLSVKDLFDNSNFRRLACVIDESAIDSVPVSIKKTTNQYSAGVLSQAQQRLWFIDRLNGGDPSYNMVMALQFLGPLKSNTIESAIDKLIANHHVLKSRIFDFNGKVVQQASEDAILSMPVSDFQNIQQTEFATQIDKVVYNEKQHIFDLSEALKIRATLLLGPLIEGVEQKVLIINLHHIAADARSVDILLKQLYLELNSTKKTDFDEKHLQYIDYAEWEYHQYQEESSEKASLSYWIDFLTDAPALHSIPMIGSRSNHSKSATLNSQLNMSSWNLAKQFCQEKKLTIFSLLSSTLGLAVGRITQQEQVLIGTPFDLRSELNLQDVVGLFVNMIPLKVVANINDKEAFLDLTRINHINAQQHGHVPFERIIDALSLDRYSNQNPLFQISISLQEKANVSAEFDGLSSSILEYQESENKFDIELTIITSSTSIEMLWNYNSLLFSSKTIDRLDYAFHQYFKSLIDPNVRDLAKVGIVSNEDEVFLTSHPKLKEPGFDNKTVLDKFIANAQSIPESIALVFNDKRFTFQELNVLSNIIAKKLMDSGVSVGDVVATLLPRSECYVVAALATIKVGAVFLPIDDRYPEARIRHILSDSKASMLLTFSHMMRKYLHDVKSISIDLIFESEVEPIEELEFSNHEALYAIYTSGSTGVPKGVLNTQKGIVNLLEFLIPKFQLNHKSRILQLSSFGFDASIWDMFLALCSGAELHILDNEILLSPDNIAQYVEEEKITYAFIPPSLLRLLNEKKFNSLSVLTVGGESIDITLAKRWSRGRMLFNCYGPAENAVVSTIKQLMPDSEAVSIGRAIPGVECLVLDVNQQRLPPGSIGELYLSGAGLALGYLNNEAKNKEVFYEIRNASSDIVRWYRTGDRVYINDQDELVFVGRIDEQVKIRGQRIELSEIENLVESLWFVESALVITREDADNNTSLVLYFKLLESFQKESGASKILRHLKSQLPSYMLPTRYAVVASWPVTANGKIDKKSLSELKLSSFSDGGERPQTETQKVIADVFSKLLSVDVSFISLNSGFFEMGGHSLLIASLIENIKSRLDVQLSIKDVYKSQSVRELAELIQDNVCSEIDLPLLHRESSKRKNGVISDVQRRLWFLHQLNPSGTEYNIPTVVKLSGEITASEIVDILNLLIERHEILRTIYEVVEGEPKARVLDSFELELECRDVSSLDECSRQQATMDYIVSDNKKPFVLSSDLPIRCGIIKYSESELLLYLNIHHIAADARSIDILFREFLELYQSTNESQEVIGTVSDLQYSDFSFWQKSFEKSNGAKNQIDYWKNQLEGLPLVHSLPLDFPRPTQQSFSGKSLSYDLGSQISEQLVQFARSNNTTSFVLIHAVLSLLIGRLSNSDDVVIGAPIDNRFDSRLNKTFGCFVNSLVLRSDLSVDMSCQQFLGEIKKLHVEAHANQYVSFEQIVDLISPERSTQYSPLFQIMLNMVDGKNKPYYSKSIKIDPVEYDSGSTKYDLTFSVVNNQDSFALEIEFNTSLFNATSIDRFSIYFQNLLEQFINDSDSNIHSLKILDSNSNEKIHTMSVGDLVDSDNLTTIDQLFREQANRSPDKVALIHNDIELTYKELHRLTESLAQFLIDESDAVEEAIGVYFDRSVDMVIAILSIVSAGKAYLPIDPELPRERIEYILSNSQCASVLTSKKYYQELKAFNIERLHAIDSSEFRKQIQTYFSNSSIKRLNHNLENLAYIIYTSGSTGNPKGVMIEHKALVNRLEWMQSEYSLNSTDRVLQKTPYGFDVSVWEFFWPLLNGATLVIADPGVHKDIDLLVDTIQDKSITRIHFVPSMFRMAVESPRWSECISLKQVFCSGEALPSDLVDKHLKANKARLSNLYGPTEAAIDVSYYECDKQNLATIPIGKPIHNVSLFVLDKELQMVPINVIGELYISGICLARGYFNNQGLTDDKFIKSMICGKECRLYRTGDLASWDEDGNLVYKGRTDHQVKLNGFRIELEEIESVVLEMEDVRNAVVISGKVGATTSLIGYWQKEENSILTDNDVVDQLIKKLECKLPQYMVPKYWQVLDRIPLSHNGKVDRNALPVIDINTSGSSEVSPPNTSMQRLIASIWSEELQIDKLGIDDNFFSLGGDSILAVRVVARLKQELRLQITVSDLFKYQSIRKLADALEDSSILQSVEPIKRFELLKQVEITKRLNEFDDVYPMSSLQSGMVFHTQLSEFNGVYHDIDTMRLKGDFVESYFRTALHMVMQRHPILRTGFDLSGPRPLQVVHSNSNAPLFVHDLTHLSHEQQRSRFNDWKKEKLRVVFDWLSGPLFSIDIFLLGADEFEFVLSFHHSILDGWSRASLIVELYQNYYRLLDGKDVSAKPTNWTFRDYIAAEINSIRTEEPSLLIRKLENVSVQQLASHHKEQVVDNNRREQLTYNKLIPVSLKLLDISKSLNVPIQATLFAMHLKALSTLIGQQNVMSCVVTNGRPEVLGSEQGLGLFLNSFPVVSTLESTATWSDLILHSADLLNEMMRSRHLPLSHIQNLTQKEFSEILFNYTHFYIYNEIDKASDERLKILDSSYDEQTNFDLYVNLLRDPSADEIVLYIDYNSDKFSREFAEKYCEYFISASNKCIDNIQELHIKHSLLSHVEINELIYFNNFYNSIESQLSINSLFENAAEKYKNNIAIEFNGSKITFEQLNSDSNKYARYLIESQVRSGDLVAVAQERSIEMVVAILGVLKCGAGYVPIDLDYPKERIKYVIEHSKIKALIGSEKATEIVKEIPGEIQQFEIAKSKYKWNKYSGKNLLLKDNINSQKTVAYVIYTSGSTGTPKGVVVTHGNVVNFLIAMKSTPGFSDNDSLLAVTPISFDIHVLELFLPLISGGKVCLADEKCRINSDQMLDKIESEGITVMQATPATWRLLMDNARHSSLSGLRAFCGGEALNKQLASQIKDSTSELWNMYGPTETSVWSSCEKIEGEQICIGRPILNTQYYVLDQNKQLLPNNVIGELHIGGRGVTRGYLRRPELTSERFLTLPHIDDEVVYATGDLVKRLGDGRYEYISRSDDQVKIRGYRIEIGEIESVLSQHEYVQDSAIVIKVDDEDSNASRLIAFVVLNDSVGSNYQEDLELYLISRLPDYMTPSQIIDITSIPLTPNGKKDRNQLISRIVDLAKPKFEGAKTPTEQILVRMWAELLDKSIEEISVVAKFFELGGHSIIALRLLNLIHSEFAVEIELQALLQRSTIRDVSSYIDLLLDTRKVSEELEALDSERIEEVEF
ncbi:non-ribosomal peptide synthetase [Pleionea litopenaei]|uniref:Amino acid adenylation domain-containing protein n=1 Tax=Pleionea litopenaei TaxID=3070815 RepID=A0AA51RTC3_9GAMM|nr:non-ribosomal peptide synthetase [Pleionea sp. HL-JVS1]WMS87321.1 amino acid adenylation domain-containing protein [Pleionea sp. HL-JVS1]